MPSGDIVTTCGICGDEVRTVTRPDWNPGRRALRAYQDMQAHLNTHSFAELLRFEIRQDLEQVPEEQRPSIVRDVYRSLLGSVDGTHFSLGDFDARSVYTIDEALGSLAMYRLWQSNTRCGDPHCPQHQKQV